MRKGKWGSGRREKKKEENGDYHPSRLYIPPVIEYFDYNQKYPGVYK
jgi:hypothetical protein